MVGGIVAKCRKRVPSCEAMPCDKCQSVQTKCSNTSYGEYLGTTGVVRTRKCVKCGHRWKTIEIKEFKT